MKTKRAINGKGSKRRAAAIEISDEKWSKIFSKKPTKLNNECDKIQKPTRP